MSTPELQIQHSKVRYEEPFYWLMQLDPKTNRWLKVEHKDCRTKREAKAVAKKMFGVTDL